MKRRRCAGELLLAALAAAVLASPAAAQAPCTSYAAPFHAEGGRAPAGEPYATRRGLGTVDAPITVYDFWKRKLAKPGAVLCLKDGLYRGKLSMVHASRGGAAGQPGMPIEIRAQNDGGVWIDGEFQNRPLRIQSSYWIVSGINFFNAVGPAVGLKGQKQHGERDQEPIHHITLRRLVAWRDFIPYGTREDYDRLGGHNVHIFSIADVTDVVIEDCAGFGWARKIFENYRSQRVTFRRNWARWDGRHPYTRNNKFAFSCAYKGYDGLCENLIATVGGSSDPAAHPASYAPSLHLIATDGVVYPSARWLNPSSRDRFSFGLRIFSSLAYTAPGARFTNVAGFHVGGSRYPNKGVKGVRIENVVAFLSSSGKPALQLQNCDDDDKKYPDGCSWNRKDDRTTSPLVVERVTAVSPRQPPLRLGSDWRQGQVVVLAPDAKIDIYQGSAGAASLCHRSVDGT